MYRAQRPGWCRGAGPEATGRPRTSPCRLQKGRCAKRTRFKVPVWAVLDYTDTRTITRELLLVKVSILGPEYLEEQLVGGPTFEPRQATAEDHEASKLERETALAHNFERSAHPNPPTDHQATPLTPSQALRNKHQHLHSISVLSNQFGAKIADVSAHSVIVEMTAKTSRVEAFLSLLKPFGILEAARTGTCIDSCSPSDAYYLS